MARRRVDPSSMNVGITRLNEILAAVSKWQQVVTATAIFPPAGYIRFAANRFPFLLLLPPLLPEIAKRSHQGRASLLPPSFAFPSLDSYFFLFSFPFLKILKTRLETISDLFSRNKTRVFILFKEESNRKGPAVISSR